MAKAKNKVYTAADSVRPYVERAMSDEKLRADLLHAFTTARAAYADLMRARDTAPFTIASRVATDEDIREKLRDAIEDLRSANDRLQGRESESHAGRNATLLVAGIALGILFNPVTGPETRRFLRDMLFGGDELPPPVDNYDGRE
jgi:hypothetical protein